MGAQIIGGLKTFNWRFCRSMPQTGPDPHRFDEDPREPFTAERGSNTSFSICGEPKPVFEAKVFPTLQEAYFSVNARARRPSVITRATL